MNTPFTRSYWVDPGRLLAGFYPGDRDEKVADQKLQGLIDCGVTCVINLMEESERDHAGRPFLNYATRLQEFSTRAGRRLEWERRAIRDLHIPSPALMTQILDQIDAAQQNGGAVYVHCWGGRGRTGTVVGCHLRRRFAMCGQDALNTLAQLTSTKSGVFWPTPEMEVQRQFVREWSETR